MAEVRVVRHPDLARALEEMRGRGLNFDLARRPEFIPGNGWRVDDHRQPLVPEPPGPPLPGGSWEVARALARDYDFAEASVVRATYDPDEPLENRTMLLELRFGVVRFYVGVRVGDVYDETRDDEGSPARVWGWNYRTLEGHLEAGQMDWQVWKNLVSGSVSFRIHAFSRAAAANPLLRLGFALFGRHEQLKFLRHTCRRMALLTAGSLADAEPIARLPGSG